MTKTQMRKSNLDHIRRAMEPLLIDMAERVIRRETVRICKWLNRLEKGELRLHDFSETVENFYWNEHAGDIEQAFIAPLTAVAALVSDETKDLSKYMSDVVKRVQATGLDHVKFFIQSASSEKDLAESLRKEVFVWHKHRAPAIAKAEIDFICKEMGVQDAT